MPAPANMASEFLPDPEEKRQPKHRLSKKQIFQ